MDARSRELWKRTREAGMWSFVLTRGILSFGTSLALSFLVLSDWMDLAQPARGHRITLTAILCVGAGALWGVSVWRIMERHYKAAEGSDTDE